jgi:ketosteroid isomerase-like protein
MLLAILLASLPLRLPAQNAPDAAELTKLLNDFLAGASRDDPATHDRFWADDLIYTRSAGKRVGKAEIIANLKPTPGQPETIFTAEDIRIQQYGTTAIVAFRLVGKTRKGDATQVANFLNTGTFLKRDGKWQAVAWQATKIPRPEEDSKKEVAAAVNEFHQAVLAADVKKLEPLLDKTFIWTRCDGKEMTRQQLLDELRAGHLKYSKLETNNEPIAIYGDAAIVRGKSFTLTFVNADGDWKAVAMQSSGAGKE